MSAALAVVLATLTTGCSLGTGDDRRMAEELAGRRYPGQLKAINARGLFFEGPGAEIAFAVTDDPDAVVRLVIDARKGTCQGQPCEAALDKAVARARSEAAQLRSLMSSFKACGHPVIALGRAVGEPVIVAEPTNATIASLVADLGNCAQGFEQPAEPLSVRLVSAEVAQDLPAGDAGWPTMMRMTYGKRLAALAAHRYFLVNYTRRDGKIDPNPVSAGITLPYGERKVFMQRVHDAVRARLRAADPAVAVSPYQGIWRLEPGTVDRLTGFVVFCDSADGKGQCSGDHVASVTVDPQGNLLTEPRVTRNVRAADGRLELPPH